MHTTCTRQYSHTTYCAQPGKLPAAFVLAGGSEERGVPSCVGTPVKGTCIHVEEMEGEKCISNGRKEVCISNGRKEVCISNGRGEVFLY